MAALWLNEFKEILPTLKERPDLRQRILGALSQNIVGKVLEGDDRLPRFRAIMADLVNGDLALAVV
jgi:hypothetical protein